MWIESFRIWCRFRPSFLQTANGKYLYLNKNISRRYFTQSQATNGNVEFFRKKKQKNTFRIFVLGESAAMGFPYPNNISFQRMLKYQLQKTNPDKDIEIINLALTAINSYTFYDFAQDSFILSQMRFYLWWTQRVLRSFGCRLQ